MLIVIIIFILNAIWKKFCLLWNIALEISFLFYGWAYYLNPYFIIKRSDRKIVLVLVKVITNVYKIFLWQLFIKIKISKILQGYEHITLYNISNTDSIFNHIQFELIIGLTELKLDPQYSSQLLKSRVHIKISYTSLVCTFCAFWI